MPEARDAMLPFLGPDFGSPSSIHSAGRKPLAMLDTARGQVAKLINSRPDDIVFESSGSEANNHAIKGIALSRMDNGRHIVASAVEHVSVMESLKALGKLGFDSTLIPVDREGVVKPEALAAAIRPDTILVTVQHASNEVGTLQDLKPLVAVARERRIPFHSDGAAAVGRVPVDVLDLGVDAYSFPAQSVYGPKGAAALYLKRGFRIDSLVSGGVQEKNRRAGTENVAAIAGFGVAADVTRQRLPEWSATMTRLARRIKDELPARLPKLVFTGSWQRRVPGHASVCVEFVEGESMLLFLDDVGIASASGSSCTARTLKVSHVLLAMGLPHALAQTSLVLTLGKDSTDTEIDHFLAQLPPIVKRLRGMSPLYAKFERGEDPYAVRPGESCEDEHDHMEQEN